MYTFEFRTGRVIIDHKKCEGCPSFACAKACSLYGTSILRITDRKPVLAVDRVDAKKRDNECLSCEIHCNLKGNKAIKIELP